LERGGGDRWWGREGLRLISDYQKKDAETTMQLDPRTQLHQMTAADAVAANACFVML
jgi:hypothetical protein